MQTLTLDEELEILMKEACEEGLHLGSSYGPDVIKLLRKAYAKGVADAVHATTK